ncbi:transporter [Ganoderma sinense ZZ0214-1]|uniref:Copper transport protein n=1 Tax=Ganoderma sinense ZZ0214-1 TaxID=1077348 RepID=A0A2G8RYH2_9APHY|nr:transporter [Ganoderma sinense ZZ0214-1]
MSTISRVFLIAGVLLASGAYAHDNGMDMSMDGAMSLASGSMIPYLHFTPGDILWFYGWVPSSKGAMVGTCIGLFLLALVDRWIAAARSVMEVHWSKRAQMAQADRLNLSQKSSSTSWPGRIRDVATLRTGLPFIPAHDVSRGIIHGAQALIHFAIMLVIMTFQASFIISIVVGLGVGEALFGRFVAHAGHH